MATKRVKADSSKGFGELLFAIGGRGVKLDALPRASERANEQVAAT